MFVNDRFYLSIKNDDNDDGDADDDDDNDDGMTCNAATVKTSISYRSRRELVRMTGKMERSEVPGGRRGARDI
ncbi:UDP-GlcNAc:betaGal beta-1,3-N-acetylglucosaminyltransferase [Dirofilaria immitis]